MNNDISRELTNHIPTGSKHSKTKSGSASDASDKNINSDKDYQTVQNCLSMLGRTKVKMDKTSLHGSVAASLDILKLDPCYVQSHIDFCDALIEQGYSLEKAIKTTDILFKGLKNKSVYEP